MAGAAFSGDGKYFSAISQDGRLRIWDTEANVLKQEYTPDLHLTSPPSCLQWITVTQYPATPKGRRKSSTSEQEVQCIALGTTSGKILIYSVAQAKVESVLIDAKNNEIHKNGVVAIDWNRKYGLYSCNKEGYLYEWDIQSAAVSNKYNLVVDIKNKQANLVSAIKIVPHSQNTPAKFIVTASAQVKLWRMHNGDAEVIKCLGHNAAPKAILQLAALKNVCWLIEGSQTERLLSFWDITITPDFAPQVNGEETTPHKKKRKKSITSPVVVPNPTYNFVLEDAPRLIDVDVRNEDDGTRLSLAAATRSGVVHYYGHVLNGASTKPIKPSVTIQVTTSDGQPLQLQCCRLPATGDLQLGYLHGVQMVFEKVTPDLKSKTQVLIRGDTKETKKKTKQTNEVNKVRADTSSNDVTYVEPMGGVTRKRATPGGKVEVPMEERLANLTVDLKSRGKTAVSHNLTKLLMQALHSKDQKLIQTVLQHNKPVVALQTVSALPADYVLQLLQQLADMSSRKTSQVTGAVAVSLGSLRFKALSGTATVMDSRVTYHQAHDLSVQVVTTCQTGILRCAAVCTWLSAVLRCHSALILASANSQAGADKLTQLLAIFTHRRSHLCQLLNLKGRLELTMSQRQGQDSQVDQQPILEYNDTSSDESEMEVERAQSDSEHSWDANESDGDGHDGLSGADDGQSDGDDDPNSDDSGGD